MKWDKSNSRLCLFRGIAAIVAALIIVSAVMPWWICTIQIPDMETGASSVLHVKVYQYGLRHNIVQLRSYIEEDETPLYQTILAWIYVTASAGIILGSAWLKGEKSKWLLVGVGLTSIAYTAIAVLIVVAHRIGVFNISLLGWSNKTYSGTVDVVVSSFASLQPGYYLAYGAGLACIVLALLRNNIIGKPDLMRQFGHSKISACH